jgi:hypothetical protein
VKPRDGILLAQTTLQPSREIATSPFGLLAMTFLNKVSRIIVSNVTYRLWALVLIWKLKTSRERYPGK